MRPDDDPSYEHMRMCFRCQIHWTATMTKESRTCPKCKAIPFMTCRAGDIGTHMNADAWGLDLSEFKEWKDET